MPQPAHFQQVIQRVLERHAGLPPSQLAEKIVDGLDLAEAIMGDGPAQPKPSPSLAIQAMAPHLYPEVTPTVPNMIIQPAAIPRYPEVNLGGGILLGAQISEEAPPAAVVRNPNGVVAQDSYETSERKKQFLQQQALEKLPVQIKVATLDGITVTLSRFIGMPPQGAEFVRVRYAQDQSEEDGPQVQLTTNLQTIDPAAIMADIETQAKGRYRKRQLKLEPRPAPTPGMPDLSELDRMARRSPQAEEDPTARADWERLTGRTIGI